MIYIYILFILLTKISVTTDERDIIDTKQAFNNLETDIVINLHSQLTHILFLVEYLKEIESSSVNYNKEQPSISQGETDDEFNEREKAFKLQIVEEFNTHQVLIEERISEIYRHQKKLNENFYVSVITKEDYERLSQESVLVLPGETNNATKSILTDFSKLFYVNIINLHTVFNNYLSFINKVHSKDIYIPDVYFNYALPVIEVAAECDIILSNEY